MKPPSLGDRLVNVSAYLTDEEFGYEHWRAMQFGGLAPAGSVHAVLVICRPGESREELKDRLAYAVDAGPAWRDIAKQVLRQSARALGSRGGKKGGKARAKSLTAKERSAIARKGAEARWGKKR